MNTDIIINMLWATIVSSLITKLTAINFSFLDVFKFIQDYFCKKKDNAKKITGQIIISGTKITTANGYRFHFPDVYRAVILKLLQNKINVERLTRSTDMFHNGENSYDIHIDSNDDFKIEDNIYISCKQLSQDTKDNGPIINLIMNIFSHKYTAIELNKIIQEWIHVYEKHTNKYVEDENIYYFSLKNDNDYHHNSKKSGPLEDEKNVTSVWKKNILVSYKTFNNTFFTDKEILLKKLRYFLNNERLYQDRGIPYNVGFLLHGEPGCGKTSCIKAISNLTKRHVVEVNLRKIKTCGDFEKIFTENDMNGKYIPHNKKIIVLEDIDCMINIVKSRKKADDSQASSEFDEIGKADSECMKLMMLHEKIMKDEEKYKPNDNLTLACILNTIDGVLENYGRILIITTNFIDKLDEALIRPGRIDMKINFTKCTNQMCRQIIEHFYKEKIDQNIQFPDYKYSPAEILELCQLNYEDINIVIKKLAN